MLALACMSLHVVTVTASSSSEGADEEDGSALELPERVNTRTDGKAISLSILGVVTALLAITCCFEKLQEEIYEATAPSQLPIIEALFSEMTVLGFLSMVTFLVSEWGIITSLSVRIFGASEEGAGLLKELFEQAHYVSSSYLSC